MESRLVINFSSSSVFKGKPTISFKKEKYSGGILKISFIIWHIDIDLIILAFVKTR